MSVYIGILSRAEGPYLSMPRNYRPTGAERGQYPRDTSQDDNQLVLEICHCSDMPPWGLAPLLEANS